MNSNNHPSAYGYQPDGHGDNRSNERPWQAPPEDTLKTGSVEVERKTFILTLKENPRGRFLRIVESKGAHRAAIIIPSTGLKEFRDLLADMIAEDEKAAKAVKPTPPEPPVV